MLAVGSTYIEMYGNQGEEKFWKLSTITGTSTIPSPSPLKLRLEVDESQCSQCIVGHLPREISRFCHYFLSYGGSLEARVRDIKPRRSPIPRGGLEIPIILILKKESADNKVFAKMKGLVEEYYVEPESITKSLAQSNVESRVDEIDLEEHSPDEVGEEVASVANEDDNMEDDDVIVIDD